MKRLLILLLLLLVFIPLSAHAQVNPQQGHGAPSGVCLGPYVDTDTGNLYVCKVGQYVLSGGGSSTSPGPIFNVTTYGASTSLADNATAFTAAFAASNAAFSTGQPVNLHTTPFSAQGNAIQTLTVNATNIIGDAVYVFIYDSGGSAFTVKDCAGLGPCSVTINTYTQIIPVNGANHYQVWKVANSKAFASVTVATAAAAESITAAVVAVPNVSSEVIGTAVSSSGTALSITQNAVANSMVVSSCYFFTSSAATMTSTSGTLRTNVPGSSVNIGMGVWATFSPSGGNITSSGNVTASSPAWSCVSLDLVGNGTTQYMPTVYIPQGHYYYSSGLNPTWPATLRCELGSYLHYTGTADAMDMGPIGGYAQNQAPPEPFMIDGCTFTDGQNMTNGIVMQPLVVHVGIRNSQLLNFGNATSTRILGTCDNWDIEIGPQNKFVDADLVQRGPLFAINSNACNFNSFARIHDNVGSCGDGYGQGTGTTACTASQASIGFIIDSLHSRVYHNNFAFYNPNIWLRCSNQPCTGNNIESNLLESVQSAGGGTILAPIQFSSGNDQLLVINNSVWLHNGGESFIAPRTGTDTLTGARINWNQVGQLNAVTPLIGLNNVVGNTNNQSYGNGCSTALSAHLPCPLLHTVGGNINQWDFDRFPSCTLVAGTCTVTLSQNYTVLPRCTATWNGVGALAGILKAVPTAGTPNTVVVTSSNAADTAGVQLYCSAGEGQ